MSSPICSTNDNRSKLMLSPSSCERSVVAFENQVLLNKARKKSKEKAKQRSNSRDNPSEDPCNKIISRKMSTMTGLEDYKAACGMDVLNSELESTELGQDCNYATAQPNKNTTYRSIGIESFFRKKNLN